MRGEVPKPYSVPEGYVPPTMREQWRYAQRRHPYQKYGYGLVFIVGLGTYAAYTISKARLVPLAIMLVEGIHKASKAADSAKA
ncbi:g6565 [Coccomyxa viridis]|uniref:G6565 protein n=1 Tax=Coccomyxa viridis TaxID=1274662 RepID=A0ABP1FVN8_9CHLO